MNKGFWQAPVKKAVSIAIIITGLLFLISNAKQWWQFRHLKAKKSRLQKQTEISEQENKQLKQTISYAKTDQFIKKEARRLGWGDKNEAVIFLPPLPSPPPVKNPTAKPPLSPWQSWWRRFFPSP